MFRRSVLICAVLFCAPVLWSALVDQTVSLETAGIHFLIALPMAGVLIWLVRVAARRRIGTPNDEVTDAGDAAEGSGPAR
jgi:MFS-type transporter involved in bile tolerance (Atg22 family)